MKTISFTCKPDDEIYLKYVLPSLLNKGKFTVYRWEGVHEHNAKNEKD